MQGILPVTFLRENSESYIVAVIMKNACVAPKNGLFGIKFLHF